MTLGIVLGALIGFALLAFVFLLQVGMYANQQKNLEENIPKLVMKKLETDIRSAIERETQKTGFMVSAYNIYTNKRKLMFVWANNQNEADKKIENLFFNAGETPTDWRLTNAVFVMFPLIQDFAVDDKNIETANFGSRDIAPLIPDSVPVPIENKSKENFVSYIEYAKEKFATTQTEKKSLDSIINKIKSNDKNV